MNSGLYVLLYAYLMNISPNKTGWYVAVCRTEMILPISIFDRNHLLYKQTHRFGYLFKTLNKSINLLSELTFCTPNPPAETQKKVGKNSNEKISQVNRSNPRHPVIPPVFGRSKYRTSAGGPGCFPG